MSRAAAEISYPRTTLLPLHEMLAVTLLGITATSTHSHECAVRQLMLELGDLSRHGALTESERQTVLATAADVLLFFNYDPTSLAYESNLWYRAAIIHQIGQGMLQAIALLRPEYTAKPFYREAAAALDPRLPAHCRQWVKEDARGAHSELVVCIG